MSTLTLNSAAVVTPDFDACAQAIAVRFQAIAEPTTTFVCTDAEDLYGIYLKNLPEDQRQHHTCNCCKNFIERYGHIAAVTPDGALLPAFWAPAVADAPYRNAVAAMAVKVKTAKVTGIWVSDEKQYGTAQSFGTDWKHFAVTPPPHLIHKPALGQKTNEYRALKIQDFGTLKHGLADYSLDTCTQALHLLKADALYRGDKFIKPVEFLIDCHSDLKSTPNRRQKDNLLWARVAKAPVGFCTPRGGMVGTLLDDIKDGLPTADIMKRFKAKMHPLQYLRPQAAPAAGNIARAEKLIAEAGLANALDRRAARLEECELLWQPPAPQPPAPTGGVFSGVKAKGTPTATPQTRSDVPVQHITWAKFQRDVLPEALTIAVYTQYSMYFVGLLTAQDPAAPPLLQWDTLEQRNPVSRYTYNGGSTPGQWNLRANTWVPVTGICADPSTWYGRTAHVPRDGYLFILAGAHENIVRELCLFPETIRSELHAVRATIEAYSKTRQIAAPQDGTANGIWCGKQGLNTQVRVTTRTGTLTYVIDRLE